MANPSRKPRGSDICESLPADLFKLEFSGLNYLRLGLA